MTDYKYKTRPFEHQDRIFRASRDLEAYALLMEMGCGKSKVVIDTAAWLWGRGEITALLVIAPNGVHRNWVINEVPAHLPDYVERVQAWWSADPKKAEREALARLGERRYPGLRILAMNVEALSTKRGAEYAKQFLTSFRCLMVVDESTAIKDPAAARTKAILKLGLQAPYRRILTGTPVTQGPLDIFAQFNFLDETILRTSSYYAFRARYAVLQKQSIGSRSFIQVVGYQRVDELQRLITPHSARVVKADCLDLPDKIYERRYVELSPNQERLYRELKQNLIAEFQGALITAPLAITKMMRLQQITGGFWTPDLAIEDVDQPEFDLTSGPRGIPQPIDERNRRIESLLDMLEEFQGKAIIWARFRAEIAAIATTLLARYGADSVVEYHGGVGNAERSEAIRRFQEDPRCRFFVGHVQAGGKGITLTAATLVVYYSNDFSLENRLQSEDRAHRIGQRNAVTYVDFVAPGTLDEKVVEALRAKKELADLITGDNFTEWI